MQKAFAGGYYDKMLGLIRGMFSQALKTNPSLKFAVLTGCLRISKESIFTGMNNLCVMTVSEDEFSDCWSLLYMTGYLTKRGEAVGKNAGLSWRNDI